MDFIYKEPTKLKVKNNRKSVAIRQQLLPNVALNQITSSSCNEHILKVWNNIKYPQIKRPRNMKRIAMATLIAEMAKKAIRIH